jgi:uncharacterized membrane protein
MYGDQSDPTKYFWKGEAYEMDEYYPGVNLKSELSFGLTSVGEPSRSDIRLTEAKRAQYVDIKLFPVQYNPVGSHLVFYPDLHLTVRYKENPEYYSPMPTRAETYDMVIITPRNYVSTYVTLADYRNSTGVITKVVAKEDVESGRYFTASGVDSQEKIKNFIKDAIETWDINYVILGGDSGQIPIRYIRVDGSSSFNNVPSDLYYADVYKSGGSFSDWNTDGDSIWGEWTADLSNTDLRVDITLGRLPSSSTTQAANMITKIQNYEAEAYGSTWFNKITCMGTDTFAGGTPEGEYYSDYLCNNYYTTGRGWSHNKLYDSTGNCNSATLLQTGNHHVGVFTMSDHGLETSWAGKVSTGTVNSFTNGNKLPIVTIDACLTGAMDVSNCLAESFLKKSSGGGISALGSSRISLGIVGTNHIWGVSGYYNRMFHKCYTNDGVKQIGKMYSGTQIYYYQNQNPRNSQSDYLVLTEYCWFGDPATSIGGFSKTHGEISCDDTDKSLDPGEEVLYSFQINNTGTGIAYVTFITTQADGSPIPMDWDVGVTPSEVTIPAGEDRSIIMNVTAPTDADANIVLDIKFKALSPNIEESPLEVTTYTTVNRVFDFNFSCPDNDHTVDAEEGTTYLLNLENTGNDQFLFGLSVIGAPEDWTIQLSNSTVDLIREEERLVQLYIKPGPTTISSTYNYKVKCYFVDQPTTFIEEYIITSVNPSNGFTLSVNGDGEKEVDPGDVVEFEVDVKNTGNHDDMVAISFPNKNSMEGWLVKSLSGMNLDLDAFQTITTTIEVTVPNDALAGEVEVIVGGELESDESIQSIVLTVDVTPQYIFDLSSDASKRVGASGAQVPFNITLVNKGNVKDIYDLSIDNKPDDWSVVLTNSISLDPFLSDTTNMVVELPDEDMKTGEYNITLQAESRSSGSTEMLYLIVDIPLNLGVELSADLEWVEVIPGESVKFFLTVKNIGNDQDTYKMTMKSISGWDVTLSKQETTIEEFSEDTLVLDVSPPEMAYASPYTLNIKCVSKTDGEVEDSVELTVYVNQVYNLQLTVTDPEASVKDEGTVKFDYTLTNTGNGVDKFTLTFDGLPSGWTVGADKEVQLDSGATHTGKITIDVPDAKSEEKKYDIKLIATSTGSSAATQETTLSVDVEKSAIGGLTDINPFSKDSSGSSSSTFLLLAIILIIVLIGVIVVVAIVVTKKRKKKKKRAPKAQQQPQQQPRQSPHPQQQKKTSYYKSPQPEYKQVKPTVQPSKEESAPVYSAPAAKPRNIPAPPPRAEPVVEVEAPPAKDESTLGAVPEDPVLETPEQPALPEHTEEPEEEPVVTDDEWEDAFDLDMDEEDDMEEF